MQRSMAALAAALALMSCEPRTIERAAQERAIEIVKQQSPGAKDIVLADARYGIDADGTVYLCAFVGGSNIPSRERMINVSAADGTSLDVAIAVENLNAAVVQARPSWREDKCADANLDRFLAADRDPAQRAKVIASIPS